MLARTLAPTASATPQRAANRPGLPAPLHGPRRASKALHVYEAIKEAILSGEFAPGSAIDKLALCQRFGVSRFPVSTAISRLAFEKLAVVEPQHGSFVSRIALADVREFMLIRRAIEGDIAAQAARLTSKGLVEDLNRSLRYQAAARDAHDFGGLYALDVEFHRTIVERLGFVHAAEVLDRLLSHLERVRRLLMAPSGRVSVTLEEHQRIADAIGAGDPDAACAAARDHLDHVTSDIERFARDNPDLIVAPA